MNRKATPAWWSKVLSRMKCFVPVVCVAFGIVMLLGAVLFFILDEIYPFPHYALRPPASMQILDDQGAPLRFFLARDDRWRFPASLDEVSSELKKTLIHSEDRFFFQHPGVNPISILRAAFTNAIHGRVVCGGSTITMQLARLAEPRKRSIWAKLVESFRAMQLERAYSKDEIFEKYLNMTPYGGNIVGVGAAAWFYFGKTPDALSLGESALLAIIPKAPTRYDPVRHPRAALQARNSLLKRFGARGVYLESRVLSAEKQALPKALHRAPMIAPHFAQLIHTRLTNNACEALPDGYEYKVRTTIDEQVQLTVKHKVRERASWVRGKGLENIAVLVLETATRKVKAMVGSANFFDDAHHGQINGTRIKRSPGSALKPFMYALAIDRGLVVPQSFLLDIPTDYAGYVAKNYDNRYRGRVTVEQSLVQSLNSPAVRLLARVGLEEFHELLKQNGLKTINKPHGHYGLPLVLGACEVTLLDLTNAYATLASAGVYRVPRFFENTEGMKRRGDNGITTGQHILSPEACHLVGRMLSKLERGDLPRAWNLTRDVPEVAWKTGTSFGHRDAWAIGYASKYTVGVWVGNLDGKAELGISGAKHAGPVLFDIMRALEKGGSKLPFTKTVQTPDWPEFLDVDTIEVCAESRHLPTPLCKDRVTLEYLPTRSKIPQDSMYRQIFVDTETGFRLEGACLSNRPSKQVVIKEYPIELANWWRTRGIGVAQVPSLSPACDAVPAGDGPKIISPSARTPYRIRHDAPTRFQKISLVAQVPNDTKELYWYQDGTLVAQGNPELELFLDPTSGTHRIVVMDDLGRMDALTFSVD